MTEEQKDARKKSMEDGHIRWIKDNCLRDKNGKDDYVFISYKSDDYEKVLDEIVYNTCKKYGLKVYFDTAFDDHSPLWTEQLYQNMCDEKCKAIISFIDNAYGSSYACLLEIMASRTCKAGIGRQFDSMFFLPIYLGDITSDSSDSSINTGLGTKNYSDNAQEELALFNKIIKEYRTMLFYGSEITNDRKNDFAKITTIYDRQDDSNLYSEGTKDSPEVGTVYLTVSLCKDMMKLVMPKVNRNDGSKNFEEVIHDKLMNAGITSVFSPITPETDTENKNTTDDGTGTGITGPRSIDEGEHTGTTSSRKSPRKKFDISLYGQNYNNLGTKEILLTVCPEIMKRHTDKLDRIISEVNIIVYTNDRDEKNATFGNGEQFEINGKSVFIGTHMSSNEAIKCINKIKNICGETNDNVKITESNTSEKNAAPEEADMPDKENPDEQTNQVLQQSKGANKKFNITLYGQNYNNLGTKEMLLTVCPEIMKRHTDKLDRIISEVNIIAYEDKRPDINTFKRGGSFEINGKSVFIGTSVSGGDALRNINRLKNICGETDDNIAVTGG